MVRNQLSMDNNIQARIMKYENYWLWGIYLVRKIGGQKMTALKKFTYFTWQTLYAKKPEASVFQNASGYSNQNSNHILQLLVLFYSLDSITIRNLMGYELAMPCQLSKAMFIPAPAS